MKTTALAGLLLLCGGVGTLSAEAMAQPLPSGDDAADPPPADDDLQPDAAPTDPAEPDPAAPPAPAEGEPDTEAGDPPPPLPPAEPPPEEPLPPSSDPAPADPSPYDPLAADPILVNDDPELAAALADLEKRDDRPWGQGTIGLGGGFGLGFGDAYTLVSLGIGGRYFFIDGLAVGLSLNDTIYLYTDEFEQAFPGITDEIPTNVFLIMPSLRYVVYRHRTASPYVEAGVGPSFYNHGGGVLGEWMAAAGVLLTFSQYVALDLALVFGSIFPESKWKEAFEYQGQTVVGCAITEDPCSFDVNPRIGVTIGF